MTIIAIDSLKSLYSEHAYYTESGIEWLGRIPSQWSLSKLGATASVKARLGWKGLKASEYIDDGYIFLSTPNIKCNSIDFENVNYITEFRYLESPEIMLHEGDVLIAKDGSTLGISNVVRKLPAPATVNSSIAVIRPKDGINSIFMQYFISSHFTQSVIQCMKGGMGVPHLFQADLRKFIILLPPIEEQYLIADFLDRETAKIDEMIEKKERLIVLLEEKCTALIFDAITKGLNPTVPMMNSGIEWLGDIPTHWRLCPLKYVAYIQTGLTLGKDYGNRDVLTRPYLRVANVQAGYLDLEHITVVSLPLEDVERYELRDGDVLMTEGGDFDKLGRGYVWESQINGCLHQNHVFAVRPDRRFLEPGFLSEMMNSFHGKMYFTKTSQQTTNLACTNSTKLKNFCFPLPCIDEQREIMVYIKSTVGKLTTLIQKNKMVIKYLAEHRMALISAAVTGKIDVRDKMSEQLGV